MRTRMTWTITAILVAVVFAQSTACRAQDQPTPAEAKTLAQEAFIFGMPNVYIAMQQEILTNVPKPEGSRAPFNQFAHYRDFPDPTNRTVVIWNVDTLYSFGTLDVTAEPIVLSIPPMGNRWWLMQILDTWNDVPAAPGTRTEGNKGGHFALCGPNYKGKLPAGLKEVRVDTSLVGVAGRTYTAGKDDIPNVHKLQDQYKLTPLSKWGADYIPPAEVPVKKGVDAKTPLGEQVFKMTPEQFFGRLCELLVNNPAREADSPVMAKIAKLGIKPGAKFTIESFDADTRKAIEEGVAAAQKAILDQEPKMGKVVNNWVMNLDTGRYGTNYLNRAAATYFFVGANLPEDAVYPSTTKDSEGKTLTGEKKYLLRFPKDQMPPANNFWSLTMYDKDGYLVENPIKRQSISDRSKAKTGDDGSLTIYVQADSPGKDKEDNWLPCPKAEPFKLYLRLYGPKKEVMEGTWKPAPVVQIK